MTDAREFHPSEIPTKPGVYVFRDRFGTVIYVGKARNLRRRLSSYFQPSRRHTADPKLRSLINSIAAWSIETVRSEDEALILESRLIKDYAPHYNILMRDDKRYLLLKLDQSERFPTLKLARLHKPDGAEYFGPFPNGSALRFTLDFLLAYFGLRACRDSDPNAETRKHCLKRIVNDCCGPCTGKITDADYRKRIAGTLEILHGDLGPIRAELKDRMADFAAKQQYERAARFRDVLDNLETVFGRKNRSFEHPELPETAPGRSGVAALQEALKIAKAPEHIIGFDISNILGTLAVASLVDFKHGRPDRSSYRRFRIKTVEHSDDFAMMAETLRRHFGRLLAENRPLPDLVMVDGGKGQLSAAVAALVETGVPPLPIIGLAKRNEEIYVPGRSDPIVLSRHDAGLQLIQALRDEAHRFAVSYHRELRNKRIEHSLLDDIPGIGPIRKRELLKEFGSVAALKKVTASEIAEKVPGLGEVAAQKLLDRLHG